ncbi:hypothetical protein BLNAU_10796 [Blattamonas nauphoetae]|uniref:Uncharacterized protein n=1 Tax=Blattamonas nauphoetae TaxID=2049346 RepID=A0ABQ9XSQ7_9EUKA|nr:hypothetical protein BLNAU_10796 [Blattamonas nauphoetae]
MSHQPFTQTFDQHHAPLPDYKSHQHTLIFNFPSSRPPVDIEKAKQRNLLEVILSQICGDSQAIRPMMLQDLLVLVTESDWALSTIPDVDYIKPLEQYCEKVKPCDVPGEHMKMNWIASVDRRFPPSFSAGRDRI